MFVHYKCFILIELTFLKKLLLIKQVHQKSMIFVIWYFLNYSFQFQLDVCNRCHDLLMMSMNLILNNISVLNLKGSNYHSIISLISKNKLNAICWFDKKKWNIIKYKNLLSNIKMVKEMLMFRDVEIQNK